MDYNEYISTAIDELIDSIHDYDFSVFRNGYCNNVQNEDISIVLINNNIQILKKLQTNYIDISEYQNSVFHRDWFDNSINNPQYSYTTVYIKFSFNENDKLVYFSVYQDENKMISVNIGNIKLWINENRWESIDGFHEQAFQKSLIEPRYLLDDFQLSNILKKFNIGE